MPSLSIPDQVIEGLKQITELQDESFNELLTELQNIPLRIRAKRIIDDSTVTLKTISPDQSDLIRDALVPLYLARVNSDVKPETFVEDISESLKRQGEKWLVSDEILSRFKSRLLSLLSVDRLNLVIKAHDFLTEHSHTFGRARILSDIRPVFQDKDQKASTAVIVHMLNIVYYQAGERHEFVVALDTKDLEQLTKTLNRATEEAKSLQLIIQSANMTHIEIV
jgi:hypothetical protein